MAVLEARREMRVHNAGSALFLKPVLCAFADRLDKGVHVSALRGAEPLVHIRASGVMERHAGVGPQRVDVASDEITDVFDALAAQVTPKKGALRDVAFKRPPLPP